MLPHGGREAFARRGLLRLRAAIPAAEVETMRDRFWRFLADRHGIQPDRVDTWTTEHPRNLQPLRRSGSFNAMGTAEVRRALDDLLGEGSWRPPKAWGLPLVTFPVPGAGWRVPPSGWHVDSHGPDHELPGVTVFAFLSTVASRGGGTAVLPGSHRLFNEHIAATGQWRPADVKAALAAKSPWLRDLWTAGTGPGRVERLVGEGAVVDGVPLRVEELTGEPGDVILMHPRTLHAPAPNGSAVPRMMLVEIVDRRP
jgi:Phytanoyl-CoA dioxygenase (PhyH)